VKCQSQDEQPEDSNQLSTHSIREDDIPQKCSEPEEEVRKIYQALKYRDRPFWQKKSVYQKMGVLKKKSLL
jgi:hypothetical protein